MPKLYWTAWLDGCSDGFSYSIDFQFKIVNKCLRGPIRKASEWRRWLRQLVCSSRVRAFISVNFVVRGIFLSPIPPIPKTRERNAMSMSDSDSSSSGSAEYKTFGQISRESEFPLNIVLLLFSFLNCEGTLRYYWHMLHSFVILMERVERWFSILFVPFWWWIDLADDKKILSLNVTSYCFAEWNQPPKWLILVSNLNWEGTLRFYLPAIFSFVNLFGKFGQVDEGERTLIIHFICFY